MFVSELTEKDLTDDIIDRLLFNDIDDTGENADCILVLGSIKASEYRVPKAVNAYKSGRAGKILLSGGAIRDFPDGKFIEAEHMYRKTLEYGIPKEDVILEKESKNTVENILCSMVVLQRAFYLDRIKKIILVTAEYHMRRSLAIARYLLPDHIEVIPCPAKDNNTNRDNWMKTPEGKIRARKEALNLIIYVIKFMLPTASMNCVPLFRWLLQNYLSHEIR